MASVDSAGTPMARLAIVASRDEYIAGRQGLEIKFAPLPKSHDSMRRSLVSTSVWFFFHAVSVFSCWLRRMLFSAGFLFALRVSRDGSVPFGVQ